MVHNLEQALKVIIHILSQVVRIFKFRLLRISTKPIKLNREEEMADDLERRIHQLEEKHHQLVKDFNHYKENNARQARFWRERLAYIGIILTSFSTFLTLLLTG